jgi:Uma2 family endonuclease
MVARGILPESGRFELVEGRLVEKEMKGRAHQVATERTRRALERLLPAGWRVEQEAPLRLPARRSEPEPDVSVLRGALEDAAAAHPGPGDAALVVEVSRTSAAKDRRLGRVYAASGIPAYWILDVEARRLEAYAEPGPAGYASRRVLRESQEAELVLDGVPAGRVPVSDLLPPAPPPGRMGEQN